ncbi:hypothetical protein [Jiangella endophytica]|uniref:hypothetical protein n=1 Tax=Jiangella endophytica TaxID=1623398 RepID=UPI001300A6F4|nr:hypothetical protein [Jiangella endophytica]
MSTVFVLLVLAVALAAAVSAARWTVKDGGPRHPLPRTEDDWSPTLPTHPYAR